MLRFGRCCGGRGPWLEEVDEKRVAAKEEVTVEAFRGAVEVVYCDFRRLRRWWRVHGDLAVGVCRKAVSVVA